VKKLIILLFIVSSACREKYVPNINEPVTGYLVVDGFINSGTGPTTISLTRTTKLSSGSFIQRETKAVVRVEGKLNTSFILTEAGATGVYANTQLALNPSDQYRLYIKTSNGKEYVSDYSVVRRTPVIDSISWRQESDGVRLYGNTHNTQEPVGFYQWKYEETWEIHSPYTTNLKVVNNPITGAQDHFDYRLPTRSDDLSLYYCWKADTLKNILVTSTEKLTQNVISMFPLQFIENNSWKLDVRYSMNARAYSISRENLKFLEQLKKNTEQLGSIFDAQPSDNFGNIHCLGTPSEVVIGFIEVTEETTKRIFIDYTQLKNWRFFIPSCLTQDTIVNKPPAMVIGPVGGRIPTQISKFGQSGSIDSVLVADPICVDCRLRGSNVKPSFW
jgi:hypothetical protein